MAVKNFLDETGLSYFWNYKIKPLVDGRVLKEEGKTLTSNDFTDDLKSKLDGVADNATANAGTITGVSIDGSSIATSGVANIPSASTTKMGAVMLSSSTSGFSETKAATEKAVAAAYTLANGKASKATTLAGYGISDAYTKTEVDAKVSAIYKPSGSVAPDSMPTPSASNVGNVYNVTGEFTTTTSFVEGSGKTYPAGTNIVVVNQNGTYKLDVLSGFIDTSEFVTSSDIAAITNTQIDTITS